MFGEGESHASRTARGIHRYEIFWRSPVQGGGQLRLDAL